MFKLKIIIILILIHVYTVSSCDEIELKSKTFISFQELLTDTFIKLDEFQEIMSDLKENAILNEFAVIEYPDSNEFDKHIIKKTNIKKINLCECYHWISRIVKLRDFYLYNGKIQFLKDMNRGDDVIFGFYKNENEIVQLIDSRVITLLIKNKHDNIEQINEDIILRYVNKYLIEFGLCIGGGPLKIEIIDKKRKYIHGNITSDVIEENYLKNKRINRFFVDSKYIIFVISKIKHPKEEIMYGMNPKIILGGIRENDERKFIRFSSDDTIDFQKELNTFFPNLKDSVIDWLGNHFKVTPDDLLLKKD